MIDVFEHAHMVPMLPCGDIDEMARFWTSLGLDITYRQTRPNPYLALGRGGVDLHYYGMDGVEPGASHSTCAIVVPSTAALYELFRDGLRSRYGRVPITGFPRMTRPRRRANNAGLSGFSVIDPAGNWIRVSGRPDKGNEPRAVDDRVEWVSGEGGPLARAVENAVVIADSHGDTPQAVRVLTAALTRHGEAPVAERAAALAYLAGSRVRVGDIVAARQATEELARLAGAEGLSPQEADAVSAAVREASELAIPPAG